MGDGKTIGCESRVTEVHTEAGQCDESGKCDPTKRALRLRSTDVELILRPLHPLPLYVTVLLVVVTVAAFRRYLDGGTIGQTGCHHPLFSLPDSCSPHLFASTCPPSSLSVAYAPSLFRWTAGSFDLSLLPRTPPPLPSLVSINVPASTTLRGYLPSPYRFPSSARILLPPASLFPLCILVLYRPP